MPLVDSHDVTIHVHVHCCAHGKPERAASLKLGPVRPKNGGNLFSLSMTTAQELPVQVPTADSQGEPFVDAGGQYVAPLTHGD